MTLSRKHPKAVTITGMGMDQCRDHTLFIQEVLRLQETEQRVHGLNMATFFGTFDELRNLTSHLILHCEQSPASVPCTALSKRCVLSQSNLRAKKYQNTSEQRWNHVLQTNTTRRSCQLESTAHTDCKKHLVATDSKKQVTVTHQAV